MAIEKYGKENVVTLTLFYGQKLSKEIECARKIAKHYGIEHYEMDLSQVFAFSKCSLIDSKTEIVHDTYLNQMKEGKIISSYVPFRNGTFLSCAATVAMSLFPEEGAELWLGAHQDDQAYADCSVAFNNKMNEAISEGTYHKLKVVMPLINMTKAQVVETGLRLGTPYEHTWSCYEGKEKACGKCGSCLDRMKAFELNGVKDPLEYEEE